MSTLTMATTVMLILLLVMSQGCDFAKPHWKCISLFMFAKAQMLITHLMAADGRVSARKCIQHITDYTCKFRSSYHHTSMFNSLNYSAIANGDRRQPLLQYVAAIAQHYRDTLIAKIQILLPYNCNHVPKHVLHNMVFLLVQGWCTSFWIM